VVRAGNLELLEKKFLMHMPAIFGRRNITYNFTMDTIVEFAPVFVLTDSNYISIS